MQWFPSLSGGVPFRWPLARFAVSFPCHRRKKAILAHSKSQRQTARTLQFLRLQELFVLHSYFYGLSLEMIVQGAVEFNVARISARIARRTFAGNFGHAWESSDNSGQA